MGSVACLTVDLWPLGCLTHYILDLIGSWFHGSAECWFRHGWLICCIYIRELSGTFGCRWRVFIDHLIIILWCDSSTKPILMVPILHIPSLRMSHAHSSWCILRSIPLLSSAQLPCHTPTHTRIIHQPFLNSIHIHIHCVCSTVVYCFIHSHLGSLTSLWVWSIHGNY